MERTSAPGEDWRYGRLAIFLHWVIALLVAVLLGLGWYMMSVEEDPGSAPLFALHISLGLTVAFLIALRLAWRFGNPPRSTETGPRWQARAARLTHWLLYLLLVLMPLTGFLGASFGGDGVAFFGMALPQWSARNDSLKEQLFGVHSFVAWLLVAVVSLHALGALKHLLLDRDGVFWRMWPVDSSRQGR
ncbi:cytochrome b [Curvibacter fontanus]|jgi:cytochrome b561